MLGRPVPWHLIGHLQTNKVKDALALFDVIHSIDRLELARECDRRARASGRVRRRPARGQRGRRGEQGRLRPRRGGRGPGGGGEARPPAHPRPDGHSPGGGARGGRARMVPRAARAGRAPRVEGAVHGDERGLRGRHRGGRHHGAGGHRHLRCAARPARPRERARERQGQDARLRGRRGHGRGADQGHRGGGPRRAGLRAAPSTCGPSGWPS